LEFDVYAHHKIGHDDYIGGIKEELNSVLVPGAKEGYTFEYFELS
jgi:hypothetical protein